MNNEEITAQVLKRVKQKGGKLTPEELIFLKEQEGVESGKPSPNTSD